MSLREGLGTAEIISVAKGRKSVFSTSCERVRGRSVIVPLLADRNGSGSGIESFGTAAMRIRRREGRSYARDVPLRHACITYEMRYRGRCARAMRWPYPSR